MLHIWPFIASSRDNQEGDLHAHRMSIEHQNLRFDNEESGYGVHCDLVAISSQVSYLGEKWATRRKKKKKRKKVTIQEPFIYRNVKCPSLDHHHFSKFADRMHRLIFSKSAEHVTDGLDQALRHPAFFHQVHESNGCLQWPCIPHVRKKLVSLQWS